MSTKKLNETPTVRIIDRGECPKLTPRGQGILSYEFGVNDDEFFIRIAANSQGGTCSFEWIPLKTVESLLEDAEESFPAVIFKKAFISRSANNHGYLAAILKAVKVIAADPDQPAKLAFLSFDSIKDQLNHLKTEDIDLPDLVAAARKEREAKKQSPKLVEPADTPKKKGRPKKDVPTP
ncbi:hypothetical protein [Desulfocastanea catecholica]